MARYAFSYRVRIDVQGNRNVIDLGTGTVLAGLVIRVRGSDNQLRLGARASIQGDLWLAGEDCLLSVGANTAIYGAHIAVTETHRAISIGARCMVAGGVEIRNRDAHSILDAVTNARINPATDVRIDDHVWLCSGCRVMKGVTIGRDSVVGVGAILLAGVGSGNLVAGVPARVVRQGITWSSERL